MRFPSDKPGSTPSAPQQADPSLKGTLQHAETLSAAGWHPEALALLNDLAASEAGAHPRFRIVLTEALLAAGRFEDAEMVTVSRPLPQHLVSSGNGQLGDGSTGPGAAS
jgi:hypothetical protein